jgi:hypothetical protein
MILVEPHVARGATVGLDAHAHRLLDPGGSRNRNPLRDPIKSTGVDLCGRPQDPSGDSSGRGTSTGAGPALPAPGPRFPGPLQTVTMGASAG